MSSIMDVYENRVELEKCKVGDRVKVIAAENGATGANGRTGTVLPADTQTNYGLCGQGIKVLLDNGQAWALGNKPKLELIERRSEPSALVGIVGIGGAPTRATTLPEEAKKRKEYPVASGFMDYFPDAICAVSNLSFVGNEQHNAGKPLHWARAKSGDEADTMMRHFLQRGTLDTDGVRHTTKMAWRALALLQKELESVVR